ncbi:MULTISPECIES: hypothetical protein [Streptomyces]|uniref:hypothetical protein n=1 Tax=Streptomyces TaxID=1883 RepID=UPI0009A4B1FE|nr:MULTISPECIES: hypothetical protein [Streptomyces]
MRLRTTAAALAGALALVLPAGAQAFADDGKALNYVYVDQSHTEQNGQVKDMGSDKCHALPSAASEVVEAVNESDSVALVFEEPDCGGAPVATLQPGEKAGDFHAASVVFQQARKQDQQQAGQQQKPEQQDDYDSVDDFR